MRKIFKTCAENYIRDQQRLNQSFEPKLKVEVKFLSSQAKRYFDKIVCEELINYTEEQKLKNRENLLKYIFANFVIFRLLEPIKNIIQENNLFCLRNFDPIIKNKEDIALVTYDNSY